MEQNFLNLLKLLKFVVMEQDISAVVSTEEFQAQLEGVAKICSAEYHVLPAVSNVEDDPNLENVPLEDILAEVDKASSTLEGNYVYSAMFGVR